MKRKDSFLSHLLFQSRVQRDESQGRTTIRKAEITLEKSQKQAEELQQLLAEMDKKYNLSKD